MHRAQLVRLTLASLTGLVAAACASGRRGRGPLPVRNQHPAQLTVMHLDAAAAEVLAPGATRLRLDTAYSSLFLAGSGSGASTGSSLVMDGELMRTELRLALGLGHDLEFGVDLPFLHTTGGVFDSFLIDYHDIFGFPDQGRESVPKNRFDVSFRYQGQDVFTMRESQLELADVPLTLTWAMQEPARGRPGVAVRAGVEVPTGDQKNGVGNGEVDYGGGLLMTWPLDWCTVHAHAQHTFAGTPDRARDAGLEFGDVTSVGLGAEFPLLDDLDAIVQFEWETSTLRQLAFRRAADDQILLWTGGRLRVDSSLFVEVAVGEDLQQYVSPDVTFWLGLAWAPSR